jgi:hypothetical protein
MRPTIIISIVMLFIVELSAQQYDCHVNKYAFKKDALPFGVMTDIDIRIKIDFDSSYIAIYDTELIQMQFQELQSRESNNGVLKRLSANWPDGKRCFIHLFIRNEAIESIEIKCSKATFMYLVSKSEPVLQ